MWEDPQVPWVGRRAGIEWPGRARPDFGAILFGDADELAHAGYGRDAAVDKEVVRRLVECVVALEHEVDRLIHASA
jgi:hypothetical protein